MTGKMTLSAVTKFLDFNKFTGHDSVLKNVIITGFHDKHLQAEFRVVKENLNFKGGMHGGFTACVVDSLNAFSLVANGETAGVTVDLHVSYLKGAKEGDEVCVNAGPIRVGKIMAYLECVLHHKSDGSIIARGTQTNYIGGG